MKGHMQDGKFHPHTDHKKGIRKSRDQSVKLEGVRLKRSDGSRIKKVEFKVWKFEDAPDDLQEKILEKLRNNKSEFGDTFFAEDQGLIFDDDEKKDATDIGLNMPFPKFFDAGSNRGTDFVQFRDLKIEDEDKFAKYLGINKTLQNKITFEFENDNNRDMSNTTLEIISPTGDVIDTDTSKDDQAGVGVTTRSREEVKRLFKDETSEEDEDDVLFPDEFDKIFDAIIKFDNLMGMTLTHLVNNYEDQFTDETLKDDAIANDYEFDEDGNIA
jgi:hypothetical protein